MFSDVTTGSKESSNWDGDGERPLVQLDIAGERESFLSTGSSNCCKYGIQYGHNRMKELVQGIFQTKILLRIIALKKKVLLTINTSSSPTSPERLY